MKPLKPHQFLGSFVLLVSALSSGHALADAQFMVPVNIKNANPKISKMGVACRLLSNSKAVLAGDETDFGLSGGAYQGTVNVNVKFAGPSSQVKSWECYFAVKMADGSSTAFASDAIPPDAVQPLAGSKANIKGDY